MKAISTNFPTSVCVCAHMTTRYLDASQRQNSPLSLFRSINVAPRQHNGVYISGLFHTLVAPPVSAPPSSPHPASLASSPQLAADRSYSSACYTRWSVRRRYLLQVALIHRDTGIFPPTSPRTFPLLLLFQRKNLANGINFGLRLGSGLRLGIQVVSFFAVK